MHANSLRLIAEMLDKHLDESSLPGKVLDVGSFDVNGTYKLFFTGVEYIGCDVKAGPNVDVVLDNPYTLPWPDDTFDLVICGQTLEHSPQPWRLVQEMGRVVKADGHIIIIAPSEGPWHMEPDTFRFKPDGMWGLATWAGLAIEECFVSDVPPWCDCVAVMKRGER